MNDRDKEWLEAMLKDREENPRLYDALANEYIPKRKVRIDKTG